MPLSQGISVSQDSGACQHHGGVALVLTLALLEPYKYGFKKALNQWKYH